MSDIETREDEWARGVFDRAHTSHDEPHWIPDAAAAARLSTHRRTRYRMTGALAIVAVAGLSAGAFATLGGGADRGGQTTAGSQAQAKTINPPADLGNYLRVAPGFRNPTPKLLPVPIPAEAVTTMNAIVSGIDPSLAHVRNLWGPGPITIGPQPPDSLADIEGLGFWTDSGTAPGALANDPSKPLGTVDVTVSSAWEAKQPVTVPKAACGLADFWVPLFLWPTSWSPCVQQKESDGSVILTSHSIGMEDGEMFMAGRRFPDGTVVTIGASSVVYYAKDPTSHDPVHNYWTLSEGASRDNDGIVAGKALKKIPWTDETLAAALSGPNVKGLQ